MPDKPNLCKSWEGTFQCTRGFRQWPEQCDCQFAERDDHRYQCRYTTEMGQCRCLEAHAKEREKP